MHTDSACLKVIWGEASINKQKTGPFQGQQFNHKDKTYIMKIVQQINTGLGIFKLSLNMWINARLSTIGPLY